MMLNKKKVLCLLLSSLFLFGCNPHISSQPRTVEEIIAADEKYASYYQYWEYGGELYCWKKKRKWECGITLMTNRLKSVEEIIWLQKVLPCPVSHMKEILQVYTEEARYLTTIFIVSVPPKQEELRHVLNLDDQQDDYIYLYRALGLEVPKHIENY